MKKSIKVFAPATVANVVCGYDILGFALNQPGDEVKMSLTDSPGIKITKILGDNHLLPTNPDKNTVSAGVQHFLKHIDRKKQGVSIELHKKMPIGSGLGSSAASTVAGLFAINKLMGEPLLPKALIPFALKGEELACGTGHADNVAPALLGGFVLIRSYNPLEVIALPSPKNLFVAVVYPQVDVPTKNAREMIRQKIQLKDAISQWGNIAGLISALYTEDLELLGRSMQDGLFEPVRSILIPRFEKMRGIALENEAVGFGISGSGPSVFSFVKSEDTALKIAGLQQKLLEKSGIKSKSYISTINSSGPKVI